MTILASEMCSCQMSIVSDRMSAIWRLLCDMVYRSIHVPNGVVCGIKTLPLFIKLSCDHWFPHRFTVTDESTIQRFFARFDEKFFQFCEKELTKINTFFLGKLLQRF